MAIDDDKSLLREIGLQVEVLQDTDVMLYADHVRKADAEANQRFEWMRHAVTSCRLVQGEDEPSADSLAFFWIRLHGVFDEIQPHFQRHSQSPEGIPPLEIHLDHRTMAAKLDDALSALTEDQRLAVFYFRHVNCHVTQKLHRKTRTKDDHVSELRGGRYLGRRFSVDEIQHRIGHLLLRHGWKEARIATSVASRVECFMREALTLMRPHYSLRR